MKKSLPILLVILLLSVIAFLVLDRSAPLPGEESGGTPPRPLQAGEKLRRGVVMDYGHNEHLDINSIRLNLAGEGVVAMDFRPHTAQVVLNCAAVGDSVEVAYTSNPSDEVVGYTLHRIENLRSHRRSNLDRYPPPPDVPANYTAENFTIDHPQLLTDPYGGIDGIQDSSLLFHFKPGLVDNISGLIKSAKTITLSAVRRDEAFGFINIRHDKVYIVLSVTINNKTFLVR